MDENGEINFDQAKYIVALLREIDSVLGVMEDNAQAISGEYRKLIGERNEARSKKDFKRADEIRKELEEKGIILEDSAEGTVWKKRCRKNDFYI